MFVDVLSGDLLLARDNNLNLGIIVLHWSHNLIIYLNAVLTL